MALSALVVSPGELTPRFDPGVSEYTAEVEDGQVTITPATSYGGAFQLLDGEGESVPDADGALGGHQIAVGSGDTTIEIRVVSPDVGDRHTYTVRVVWAGEPRVPAIAAITPGASSLEVSWGMPTDIRDDYITSYDLRHIQSSAPDKTDSNWTMLDDVWTSGPLSHTVKGLIAGTGYDVQLRAVTSAGVSPWSATVSGTPTEGECSTEGAVSDAANNPGLVADCEVLLAARDTLAGTASLNWSPDTPITAWDGVTVGGTPQRVTGLALVQEQLSGSIPPELGSLPNLQSLLLSGNQLTGCIPQGLRDVASNDLASLGLPFCDVLLSGLTISPGVLTPAFTPYQIAYTAAVGPSPITVTPANAHNAAIAFLGENDVLIPDADGALAGHQVDLGYGTTIINIKATSQDGKASLTYAIEVTRSGSPDAPAIADPIAAGPASLTVSWTAPAETGGTDVTSYDLRHIESGAADKADANWTGRNNIWSSGALRYDLGGLTNGVSYDVLVRAVNAVGHGPWSPAATGTPRTTPGAPVIDSLIPGGGALNVGWSDPATDGGAEVTGYDLRFIRSGAPDKADANWTEVVPAWSTGPLSYAFGSLTGGTPYDVQVRAVNASGPGLWSATFAGTPVTIRASRSFSPTPVSAGGELEVTITAAGYGGFGGVVETLPIGFSYVSSSLSDSAVTVAGQEVSFTLFGETAFTYTVAAPSAEGTYSFSGVLKNSNRVEQPVGGVSSITVEAGALSVSITRSATTLMRIGLAIPVTAVFSKPVSGFAVQDVSVTNGGVSNFAGSGRDYAFDVTPNAIGKVTVDIAAGAATDAGGNGNAAAGQLALGIPYDDDGNGAIGKSEVVTAINDYLFGEGDEAISKSDVITLINLYLFG